MNQPNQPGFGRTDLAIERLDLAGETTLPGISREEREQDGIKIISMQVCDPASAEKIGKACGTYYTIEPTHFQSVPLNFEQEVDVIAEQMRSLLPDTLQSAFLVGLGNAQITPDALGPQVIRNTLVTRHLPEKMLSQLGLSGLCAVSAIAPGVLGQTGMESAEIVQALCAYNKPDVVFCIDALASKSLERLGCTIQLSDSGISPGSGVLNKRKELSQETLGVPVIAVGVPTVVDLATIAQEYSGQEPKNPDSIRNMMVTPREIDVLIEHAAKVIGYSITRALQPMLRVEDIAGLVS